MDTLPEELQLNIFQRLPLKSLGLCMCVRKKWRSMIKTPSFVSKMKNNEPKYLVFWINTTKFELHIDDDGFDFHKLLTLPPHKPPINRKIVNEQIRSVVPHIDESKDINLCMSIYDGVICYAELGGTIRLWNPAICKLVTLPDPSIKVADDCLVNVAFCFDSLADDYKVIRIVSPLKSFCYQFDVFSLKSFCWKPVNELLAPESAVNGHFTILDGTLHWLHGETIHTFDVNAEVFRKINFGTESKDIFRGGHRCSTLAMFKGTSLAICSFYDTWMYAKGWMEVRVMKEYGNIESWSKIYEFDVSRHTPFLSMLTVACARGLLDDGNMLWELYAEFAEGRNKSKGQALFSIDLESEKRKIGPIPGTEFKFDKEVTYFQESLVLLDNVNAVTIDPLKW